MSKPFDATTRQLVEFDPLAWLRSVGLPGTIAEMMDADLSTITSEADRILRVINPNYLAHLELQSSFDAEMIPRLLRYNVLIFCKYGEPVVSILFLLRKEAERTRLPGVFAYGGPEGSGLGLEFHYHVARVWELNLERILNGPLAMLPLASLTDGASEANLPEILQRMQTRIDGEMTPVEKADLWTSAFIMLGLKYKRQFIDQLWKGVLGMKESVTYQMILEEGEAKGKAEGERKMLLLFGEKRLGVPDAATQAKIEAITSVEQIEHLGVRLMEVESWSELLQ